MEKISMEKTSDPKRIVLATFGSFGDIHPYMSLALELNARGHNAVIASSSIFREKIEGAGIEFYPIRPDLPRPDDPAAAEMVAKIMDPMKGAKYLLKEIFLPPIRDSYQDTLNAAQGADLIVTHPITFAGPAVAQKLQLPWVSTVLAPASIFSVHDPCIPPVGVWLGRILRKMGPGINRALLNFVRRATDPWFEELYQLRKALGLSRGGHPLFEGQHSPQMVLAMFSRVMAEPQPDWPKNSHVTGFPFYDKKDETPVSPDLLKFLDDGPPPIVFTLGSSAVFTAGEFFTESIEAAKRVGQRALLLIGDQRNMPSEPLPPGIAAFDYAPHSLVFPRANVIVHQAGVGTTGQALISGVPQLIVPFNHDQPDNAERVARLGAGRTIGRSQYKADRVAAELDKLLKDPTYTLRALSVSKEVMAETGAATAADLIEKKLGIVRKEAREALVNA